VKPKSALVVIRRGQKTLKLKRVENKRFFEQRSFALVKRIRGGTRIERDQQGSE